MIEIKTQQLIQARMGWLARIMIFLSGSIEKESPKEDWREVMKIELENFDVFLFNSRREDWDPQWDKLFENVKYREHIELELLAMEKADIIAINFSRGKKATPTLLQFGLWAGKDPSKLIVYCPYDYALKGYVDTVCFYYKIQMCTHWANFVVAIMKRLEKLYTVSKENRTL